MAVENWLYFLRLCKATASHSPQQFFTGNCNVIFGNYCVSIMRKICHKATPVHGAMTKFADRLIARILFPGYYYKSFQYYCNCSEDVELPVQDMPHTEICACDGSAIIC